MAAGLGFKTFNTGDVLTAGDTNGYLMQGILVFATEAARNAAITAPAEGQFAFTKDNNTTWFYDGAAWVVSGATGDITAVTAGTGISGGGASGDVTVTNSMATAIDAKGDLVPGTGADTFARLAVGANDTVLTADSTTATGLKWAAAAGGKVLQVVNTTFATETANTTTTLAATGLTLNITPTLNTSKILVIVNQGYNYITGTNTQGAKLHLYKNGSTLQILANRLSQNGNDYFNNIVSATYLDSPATNSAITYATFGSLNGTSGTVYWQGDSTLSSITLIEIGA